ncbi:MAG: metal ABC transporter permease [Fluviicola sp.]|jgi:manganese/zinc/iron transport system permease protein|nr:metal ABC transporter permease [Fluviicola sp.]
MELNDFLTLLTAITIAVSCSLLGCFLVLRKTVMVGDAISHSVLPGIAIAYLLSSSFNSVFMLIGAAVFGVFTTLLIDFFHKKLKLQEDASIGITFTWLFAIGVIIITLFTNSNTDLDQDCVLFGELSSTFLDKIIIGDYLMGTRSFWMIFPVFLIILVFILFGYKGLSIISFNEDYAKSLGINVGFINLIFMSLVSVTTVMSFESVGAILVVGLLVIPPATAYLITDKLKRMLIISCFLAITSCIIGFYLSILIDVTASSMIIVVSGCLFLLTFGYINIKKTLIF